MDNSLAVNLQGIHAGFFTTWQSLCNLSDGTVNLYLRGQQVLTSAAQKASIPLENIMVKSTTEAKRLLCGKSVEDFERRIMCRCHALYITNSEGQHRSKRCSASVGRGKKTCDAILMRTRRTKNGKQFLVPRQTFCFGRLAPAVKQFSQRPAFWEKCQRWKQQSNDDNNLRDVYDGKMWQ